MKVEAWKDTDHCQPRALAMEAVLYASSFAGTICTILPHEDDANGNPIATFIFRGQSVAFHSFLLCVIFAFTGSLCALLTANKASWSRLFFHLALISTASAAAIFVFAASSGGCAELHRHQTSSVFNHPC